MAQQVNFQRFNLLETLVAVIHNQVSEDIKHSATRGGPNLQPAGHCKYTTNCNFRHCAHPPH